MDYYINHNNVTKGPFSVAELEKFKIPANTLVSSPSGDGWIEASKVSELSGAIGEVSATTANHSTVSNANYHTTPPVLTNYNSTAGQYNNTPTEPTPKTWLVESILSLLFCCWPFALVSLIYSIKVENLYIQKDYIGSLEASNNAKKWFFVSIFSGLAVLIIYIAMVVIIGAEEFANALLS